MLIDWLKLLPALALLLPPIALFHGNRVRYRDVMSDWGGYWGRTVGLGLHTIDLARALLGAWLLADALRRVPDAQGLMKYSAVVAHASILCLSTLLQTAVCKESESAHAPFAFVTGLVLGFLPPLIAGLALVCALVVTLGSRLPASFFPFLAIGVGGIGALFTGKKLVFSLVSVGVAVMLPWLFTLLFPRHLVCTHLARPKAAPVPPPK